MIVDKNIGERETWGAYFGSDGYIYASDFWLGFFILNPG
jgi:hypothetical protein